MSKSKGTEEALAAALAYATAQGALVGDAKSATGTSHVPFSLLPTRFPARSFDAAMRAAQPFGALVDAIADDPEALGRWLATSAAGDAFTGRLLDIYNKTRELTKDDVRLGIHRSDYMLRENAASLPGSGLVQIELNTISCAFAALGTKVVELHRHLAESGFVPDVAECGDAEALAREFPVSDALGGVAAGLAAACAAAAPGAEGAVVVMVVQPGEKNSFDQSILAATLQRAHGVRTLRRTLAELGPQAAGVGAAARELWIEDDLAGDAAAADETTPPAPPAKVRVGVVYYRAGYTPRDYPGEAEWDARLALERTSAAKCPTVGYQLAGTKKVQQVLAAQGALVPYLADQAERDAVRATFAGLWPLDGDRAAVDAVVARAIADPPHFVLKPQREGGGNNLYDAAMVEALRTLPRAELEAHILMERVYPPATAAYIVRRDAAVRVDRCVSELGVFTVFIASGSRASGNLNVSLNEGAGYILRTKSATDADGGVAAGVAVMDSVQLQH